MSVRRRDFLRAGLSAFAVGPPWARWLGTPSTARAFEPIPIDDSRVRQLAMRAIEAARAAGAVYADVRLSHTRELNGDPMVDTSKLQKAEWLNVGLRALVNGCWGFSASTVWLPDEMDRLGREAVYQAKTARRGGLVHLAPSKSCRDGHWRMPVERDPFEVPEGEILDHLASVIIYARRKWGGTGDVVDNGVQNLTINCWRQDKAFASTEGGYCTQRLYQTRGVLGLVASRDGEHRDMGLPVIEGAGRGWEYVANAPLREAVDRGIEELLEYMSLPLKAVEVGRYDVAFDAESMARLVDGTFGTATECDRVLGFEANAGGTSYLNDPAGMLGAYQVAAPSISITGERSAQGGLATVGWDDEGVEPDRFHLVRDGVLDDLQTTRETAASLREVYASLDRPTHSHGCATAPRAHDFPLLHPPNLTLAPGKESLGFDDLIRGMKRGLAVTQLGSWYYEFDMDFQCLNGYGRGWVYQIKDGKRVARHRNASFLIRTPELWKNVQALGGAASQYSFAHQRRKGEPPRLTRHTVTAVPGLVQQVTTVNPTKGS